MRTEVRRGKCRQKTSCFVSCDGEKAFATATLCPSRFLLYWRVLDKICPKHLQESSICVFRLQAPLRTSGLNHFFELQHLVRGSQIMRMERLIPSRRFFNGTPVAQYKEASAMALAVFRNESTSVVVSSKGVGGSCALAQKQNDNRITRTKAKCCIAIRRVFASYGGTNQVPVVAYYL